MSYYMGPSNPSQDQAHRRLINTVLLSDYSLSIGRRANRAHSIVSQLRHTVIGAEGLGTAPGGATFGNTVIYVGLPVAKEQMARLTAGRVIAVMQHPQAYRHRPVMNFPRHSMCAHLTTILAAASEQPVTLRIGCPRPFPAAPVLHDEPPESVMEWCGMHTP